VRSRHHEGELAAAAGEEEGGGGAADATLAVIRMGSFLDSDGGGGRGCEGGAARGLGFRQTVRRPTSPPPAAADRWRR